MNSARKFLRCLPLAAIAILIGCGNKPQATVETLPADFNSRDDVSKVDYMMKHVAPDSVARFICNGALGMISGVNIDTITIAVNYAYENYNDSNLINFSREFDEYAANLPLHDKMKIYLMIGASDHLRLGYELGLEYVAHIRKDSLKVEEVMTELESFKTACADDSMTYVRFLKGFKTALTVDHGRDLPENIYNAFINY